MKTGMGRKLPLDTQTFEILRNEGYIYVDKTGYIQRLLDKGRIFFSAVQEGLARACLFRHLSHISQGGKISSEGLRLKSTRRVKEIRPGKNIR